MIDDKRWDEHMNRVIGQLARYAHAEIRRMAAEARDEVSERIDRIPDIVAITEDPWPFFWRPSWARSMHLGSSDTMDLRKYVTGAKWIDYEARVVDGLVVGSWENGERVYP